MLQYFGQNIVSFVEILTPNMLKYIVLYIYTFYAMIVRSNAILLEDSAGPACWEHKLAIAVL